MGIVGQQQSSDRYARIDNNDAPHPMWANGQLVWCSRPMQVCSSASAMADKRYLMLANSTAGF